MRTESVVLSPEEVPGHHEHLNKLVRITELSRQTAEVIEQDLMRCQFVPRDRTQKVPPWSGLDHILQARSDVGLYALVEEGHGVVAYALVSHGPKPPVSCQRFIEVMSKGFLPVADRHNPRFRDLGPELTRNLLPTDGILFAISVQKQFRRAGRGAFLVEAVSAILARNGCHRVWAFVSSASRGTTATGNAPGFDMLFGDMLTKHGFSERGTFEPGGHSFYYPKCRNLKRHAETPPQVVEAKL